MQLKKRAAKQGLNALYSPVRIHELLLAGLNGMNLNSCLLLLGYICRKPVPRHVILENEERGYVYNLPMLSNTVFAGPLCAHFEKDITAFARGIGGPYKHVFALNFLEL